MIRITEAIATNALMINITVNDPIAPMAEINTGILRADG